MMKYLAKKLKILLLVLFIFFTQPTYCANIIFDLGKVLVNVNKSSLFFYKIGIWKYLKFLVTLNNPFSLKNRFFEILANIEATSENICGAQDGKGNKLPDIIHDWMTNVYGINTCEKLREQINTYFENNPDIFYGYYEKDIISDVIKIMLTPDKFIDAATLFNGAVRFVEECATNGHKLFILSNWDIESFALLYEKFPELFELFEPKNIIISGEVGVMKPDLQIYAHLLDKHNLDPQNCIFFDDQEVNIEAAEKFGIHGILCKKPDYNYMRKKLDDFLEYEQEFDDNLSLDSV